MLLETIFASGVAINKAVSYFSGLEVTGSSWPKGRNELGIGGGFYLLAESHELGREYHKQQSKYGYAAKYGTLLLYKYKPEKVIAIYDDPFQKFIKIAVALCLATTCKVYPFSFAVINDAKKPVKFYRLEIIFPATITTPRLVRKGQRLHSRSFQVSRS